MRRILQIKSVYPHLNFQELRGNIDTRLRRLDNCEYDAMILAVAGLSRLGLAHRISEEVDPEVCLPAVGQGALGIQARLSENEINVLVSVLNHEPTWIEVSAERRVAAALGANCNLPIAVFGKSSGDVFSLRAFVSDLTGSHVIRESKSGKLAHAADLAIDLADCLLELGAAKLIV